MEIVAAAEGCAILGISRPRWYQLVQEPGFPQPIAVLSVGAIYDGADIRRLADRRAAERRAQRILADARRARKRPAAPKRLSRDRQSVPALPADLKLP